MEFPKWVQGHGGVPTIVHSPAHEARVVHGPTIDDDNDPEDRPSRVDSIPESPALGSTADADRGTPGECSDTPASDDAVDPPVADPGTPSPRVKDSSSVSSSSSSDVED